MNTKAVLTDEQRDQVRDAVAEALGSSAYDCTRVWSAWGYGTMGEDDFVPITDDESRLYEIADAAIAAFMASADNPSTAGATKPVGNIGDYSQFHAFLDACYEAVKVLDNATGGEVFDASDKLTDAQNKLVDYINDWSARLAAPALNPSEVHDQAQWISVEERLPEDGEWVQIFGAKRELGHYQAVAMHVSGDFYEDNDDEQGEYINVTHWMPLPAAPEQIALCTASKDQQGPAERPGRERWRWSMSRNIDHTGKVFGRLTAIARKHSLDGSMITGQRYDYWRAFGRDLLQQFTASPAQASAAQALADRVVAWSADKASAAQEQARAAVTDGWKLVPAKPTDDMIVAFAEQWYSKVRCIDDCEMEDCYAAMLAAAPSPTKGANEGAGERDAPT